jgi:predicted ribosomally synthesized peptide with nif11-like leader
MSMQSAKDFLKKIKTDQALEKKLEAADPKARPQIVKDAGFDFTREEFDTAAKEMGGAQELSAEELQGVAGGAGRAGSWCVFNWK